MGDCAHLPTSCVCVKCFRSGGEEGRLVTMLVFEEVRRPSLTSLAATLIKAQTDGTATTGKHINTVGPEQMLRFDERKGEASTHSLVIARRVGPPLIRRRVSEGYSIKGTQRHEEEECGSRRLCDCGGRAT